MFIYVHGHRPPYKATLKWPIQVDALVYWRNILEESARGMYSHHSTRMRDVSKKNQKCQTISFTINVIIDGKQSV